MDLKIDRDPLGGVVAHASATRAQWEALTPRQQLDFQLALSLLNAAVMSDESFDSDHPLGRAMEVMTAHEYELTGVDAPTLVVATAQRTQPSIEEER